MGKRGRKSAAELAAEDALKADSPRDPPDDFTEAQIKLWNDLINRHGIFHEDQWNMVEAFVRSSTSISRIGQYINALEQAEELDVKAYDSALRMREREVRLVASLGIRLGIAKKANHRAIAPNADPAKAPWQ